MYRLDVIVQGYPGKTINHGGLGWTATSLLRGNGETVIVDPGFYNTRDLVTSRLRELGVQRHEVTSVLVTHCHWDHLCNYPIFPNAKIFISRREIEWALRQPIGTWHVPEFHVEKLASSDRAVLLADDDMFLPEIRALSTPGHTPGHFGYIAAGERGSLI